jgi:hypothetical protein
MKFIPAKRYDTLRSDVIRNGAIIYFTFDDIFTNDRILCGAIWLKEEIAFASQRASYAVKPHKKIINNLENRL